MPAIPLSPQARRDISEAILRRRRFADIESSDSALAYLQHVVIDSRPEPRLFREAAEAWQWTLLSRLIPAIESIAGVRKDYTGPRYFFVQLPRGHDKTSSIARLSTWALAYAKHPLRATVAAADREQASFLHEFAQAEAKLNPFVAERIEFKNWQIIGRDNGARLKILSADDKSSFGLREDLYILDELTVWPKRGLWNTIVSGLEKVPGCVLIVITNAGTLRSWQHDVFAAAKDSPDWFVYASPPGVQLARWMSEEKILKNRRMLPPSLARRVYDNVWIDEAADCSFVSRDEATACVDSALVKRDCGIQENTPYYVGIDYGPVRDRSCCCILHAEDNRLVVDRMDVMQGSPTRRVPIELIEKWITDAGKLFHRPTFVIDPHNLEGTLQKFEGYYDIVRAEPRGGKYNYEIAANLRSLVVNGRVAWYPDCGGLIDDRTNRLHSLVDELCEVVIQQKQYGYRITNEDGYTHDDRVVALAMAAYQAVSSQARIDIPTDDRWF